MKSERQRDVGRAARTRSMIREIVVAAVLAVHGGQDGVRARLHRQVQIGHQFRQVAMGGHESRPSASMSRGWLVV